MNVLSLLQIFLYLEEFESNAASKTDLFFPNLRPEKTISV